jgi:hypothetical protein
MSASLLNEVKKYNFLEGEVEIFCSAVQQALNFYTPSEKQLKNSNLFLAGLFTKVTECAQQYYINTNSNEDNSALGPSVNSFVQKLRHTTALSGSGQFTHLVENIISPKANLGQVGVNIGLLTNLSLIIQKSSKLSEALELKNIQQLVGTTLSTIGFFGLTIGKGLLSIKKQKNNYAVDNSFITAADAFIAAGELINAKDFFSIATRTVATGAAATTAGSFAEVDKNQIQQAIEDFNNKNALQKTSYVFENIIKTIKVSGAFAQQIITKGKVDEDFLNKNLSDMNVISGLFQNNIVNKILDKLSLSDPQSRGFSGGLYTGLVGTPSLGLIFDGLIAKDIPKIIAGVSLLASYSCTMVKKIGANMGFYQLPESTDVDQAKILEQIYNKFESGRSANNLPENLHDTANFFKDINATHIFNPEILDIFAKQKTGKNFNELQDVLSTPNTNIAQKFLQKTQSFLNLGYSSS